MEPADSSTHAEVRNRRLAAAYLTGFLGRGLAIVTPLILVPLMLQSLGKETFGVWVTATSFTSMFVFADLGLGAGLLTKLSAAFGHGDMRKGKSLVSNAYFAVAAVSFVGVLLALLLVHFGEVSSWMGVEEENATSADQIVLVVVVGFLVVMPLSLIVRVQLGVQQAWQSNMWAAVGPLLSVPIVWILIDQGASPTIVVIGSVAGPLVVSLINNLVFFLGPAIGRSLVPAARLVTRSGVRELLGLGSAFAALSILSNVSINIDNTLIAVIRGSADVAVFAIAARVFRSIALLVNIVGMPLWGAAGEALARHDVVWVRRATRRTAIALPTVAGVVSALIVLFREQLVGLWVGPEIATPIVLYGGFAVWGVLVSLVTPFFMVQNSAGVLQPQLFGWGAYLVLSIPAKAIGMSFAGPDVIPWVSAVCFAITVLPSALLGYRRVLRKAQRVAT